jgi:predicted transposase/invertase (TIGR01784 family)
MLLADSVVFARVWRMKATFVNPLSDFGFKKIFGEEASKNHLIDFLNALLPETSRIKDLSFKNLEQLPNIDTQRKAVYDIYCQGVDGDYFIVELQKVKQEFFKDRTIYYATFPIQAQAQKGDWDFRLEPVYCIGVLGFSFDKDDNAINQDSVVHRVQLKNQNNEVFYQKLTFIYLEIPDFNKSLEQLETRLDKWLYFIKNLEDLQNIPELLKDDVFVSAFETAKLANLNFTERENYEQSLKVLRDNYATMKAAKNEARAEGKAEGRAEGRAEGKAEGKAEGLLEGETKGREAGRLEGEQKAKLEIARNLKTAGLTNEQIKTATGLTDTDLERL